jgi:hypothetical protein
LSDSTSAEAENIFSISDCSGNSQNSMGGRMFEMLFSQTIENIMKVRAHFRPIHASCETL